MGWTEHRSFQSYRCSFEGEIFLKTIQVSWPWADSQTGLMAGILQIIHGNAFGWTSNLKQRGPLKIPPHFFLKRPPRLLSHVRPPAAHSPQKGPVTQRLG